MAGAWNTGPTVTSRSATVAGLSPNVSYDVQVVALNPLGSGPASSVLTAQTAAATAVNPFTQDYSSTFGGGRLLAGLLRRLLFGQKDAADGN